jgi:hypothetical protein
MKYWSFLMNRNILSLDDFKKWIEESDKNMFKQQTEENIVESEEYIGKEVQSRIGLKKLIFKSQVDEGNEKEVCLDFFKNGGVIIDCEEDQFLIEVESGQLYINKSYVDEI